MKKLIMILLTLFLLGKMPAEVWNEATQEQQKGFMEKIANQFGSSIGCRKGMLLVITQEKDVYFYFNCEEVNDGKPAPKISDT